MTQKALSAKAGKPILIPLLLKKGPKNSWMEFIMQSAKHSDKFSCKYLGNFEDAGSFISTLDPTTNCSKSVLNSVQQDYIALISDHLTYCNAARWKSGSPNLPFRGVHPAWNYSESYQRLIAAKIGKYTFVFTVQVGCVGGYGYSGPGLFKA